MKKTSYNITISLCLIQFIVSSKSLFINGPRQVVVDNLNNLPNFINGLNGNSLNSNARQDPTNSRPFTFTFPPPVISANNNNYPNNYNNINPSPSSNPFILPNNRVPNINTLINSSNSPCNSAQEEQDRYLNRVTLILLITLFSFWFVSSVLSIISCILIYRRYRYFN